MLLVEALQRGEEGERRVGALVGEDAREAESSGVVDGNEDVLPAGSAAAVAAIASDAVARLDDATQLLDVDVDELARALALVADDRLWRSRRP